MSKSTPELLDEYDRPSALEMHQLNQIYEEFRKRGDAPECLRQYLFDQIGRVLP